MFSVALLHCRPAALPDRVATQRLEAPVAGPVFSPTAETAAGSAAKTSTDRQEMDRCSGFASRRPPELTGDIAFGDFVGLLGAEMDAVAPSEVQAEFETFVAAHGLSPDAPRLRQDYARLRMLFEAVRDAGFWQIRWDITNQEPSSRRIWQSWARTLSRGPIEGASATAECDEISALYSILARRLGVRKVGLFYPTWNHTIASWTPTQSDPGKPLLVLIPTTQIFLSCEATFDRTTFAAPRRTAYEYPGRDVADTKVVPKAEAEFLLRQMSAYGPATPDMLSLLRAHRAQRLRSSMGPCLEFRQQLARRLAANLSCEDRHAMEHYFSQERATVGGSSLAQLAALGEP